MSEDRRETQTLRIGEAICFEKIQKNLLNVGDMDREKDMRKKKKKKNTREEGERRGKKKGGKRGGGGGGGRGRGGGGRL